MKSLVVAELQGFLGIMCRFNRMPQMGCISHFGGVHSSPGGVQITPRGAFCYRLRTVSLFYASDVSNIKADFNRKIFAALSLLM